MQNAIGKIIAFSDTSGIAYSYFKNQIATCCDKSNDLSHDELRALSSSQIAILHRTSSGKQLKQEKKEMDQDGILTHSRFNGTVGI